MSAYPRDYAQGFFPEIRAYKGPVEVAFSGGRSSAMMLKLLLDQHGGKLPDDWLVLFNNTGAEHPKTLDFVHEVETRWGVDIHWLELADLVGDAPVVRRVTYETASRKREPFKALLQRKSSYPPRRRARLCTLYMKVLLSEGYLRSLGWTPRWTKLVGYRQDEKHRLHNALVRCGKPEAVANVDAPLVHAGISKAEVNKFWQDQSFDLGIGDHLGNCIFCFLKSEYKLRRAARDEPAELLGWIEMEEENIRRARERLEPTRGAADLPAFDILPGGYRALRERVVTQLSDQDLEDYQDLECNCTD